MNPRMQMARMAAITRRDWRTERTYRFRYVFQALQLAGSGVIVYYVSQFVMVDQALLGGLRGRYFDFAMAGLAVMTIAQLGIGTFNDNIMREQTLGTLEVLFATPTPLSVLLAGSFVFPLILTVFELIFYLVVGIGVFGAGLSLVGALLAIPVALLTLATFCAFGIISASVVVLAKRGDPLSAPLLQLTALLSGAVFPVEVLPTPFEVLARLFPAYYGINGLREALLGSATLASVGPDLLILAGFAAVLLPLSLHLFSRALSAARRLGTLGNY